MDLYILAKHIDVQNRKTIRETDRAHTRMHTHSTHSNVHSVGMAATAGPF